MSPKNQNKETLTVDVNMDENMIPESISWTSSQDNTKEEASAALLYFWNASKKETFNLDLWTKKMSIEEMNMMIFQSFMTVANTYERATSEDQLANAMRDFAEFFGEKTCFAIKNNRQFEHFSVAEWNCQSKSNFRMKKRVFCFN